MHVEESLSAFAHHRTAGPQAPHSIVATFDPIA
jgi:hypothetical protein